MKNDPKYNVKIAVYDPKTGEYIVKATGQQFDIKRGYFVDLTDQARIVAGYLFDLPLFWLLAIPALFFPAVLGDFFDSISMTLRRRERVLPWLKVIRFAVPGFLLFWLGYSITA